MTYRGNSLTTLAVPLHVARNEADENGAAGAPAIFVLATEGNFAQMPSTTLDLAKKDLLTPKIAQPLGELEQNGLAFSFTGGSAAGKTFTADFYTWANQNGPAKHTVNMTAELGTQQVVIYPHDPTAVATDKFWADKMTLNWENHLKEVEVTDDVGRNSVGEIWFDATGLRYVFIQILSADGSTGTEAGDIAVFYRWF